MSNPIIGRPDAFTRSGGSQQMYAQGAPQYGAAPTPQYQQYQQPPVATGGVMTLDDVLAKTAITLGVVALAAAATVFLMPGQLLFPALIVSALVGFVTVIVVAGRARIPVGGVLFYAAVEGVFIGAISSVFERLYPGIVASAVLATFVTAGATLAAYKFFNIRVTPKFRKMVFIGTASLAGVFLVNLVLALFNIDTGLRGFGGNAGLLSIGISILAVGLAVMNLVVDFDSVERGIAAQAPAGESWRAAFGITVTMVWLYVEILRILSYFRD
ncbi:MAG: Bax inhibitor-1/YccA family protein [Arachnia sp.]